MSNATITEFERNTHIIGCKKIAEGKTKIVYQYPEEEHIVFIAQKPQLTAGDGEKKTSLEDKDLYANRTAHNVFNLLNCCGISTHYIGPVSANEMMAKNCRMIPLEVVIRRIAFGSYLKRNPNIREGDVFEPPVVEFFFKDDKAHDPLLEFYKDRCFLFDAKKPLSEGYIGCRELNHFGFTRENLSKMEDMAKKVFEILEYFWKKLSITLVDLKIEFGFTTKGNKLVVADVIDNDSWRIWPGGDKNKMLDKQLYRDSSASMEEIGNNYALVAEMTNKFFSMYESLINNKPHKAT